MFSEFYNFPLRKDGANKGQQNLLIESDEKRIKQVLMNLQSNALKFTKEGGAIKIVCTYVKPGSKKGPSNKYTGHDSYSSQSSKSSGSDSGSENSENY